MRKLSLLVLLSANAFAQFSEPVIIDNTELSGGIKKIAAADINNDGFTDIIVAQPYQIDNIACYMNNGNGGFLERQIIDADLSDPVYVTTGDFNADGWLDIAAITQTNADVFVYINDTDGSFTRETIDSGTFFFGNAVVSADYDNNGFDDIVAIGQHSIDYYHNINGSFTKEHILTTSTSPNILECLSLATADMDNDGDMDLVTGETLGGVIYFNDGNGVFTPDIFTVDTFISRLVHITDVDNDGDKDILIHHTPGMMNLYLNDGTGEMTFHSTVFNDTAIIESMQSVDIDNDGFMDIYTAFGNIARAYPNTGETGFGDELTIQVNDNIFITQTAVADIDNDGVDEYIWSGVNATLAYQKNTVLDTQHFARNNLRIYPNPVQHKLYIAGNNIHGSLSIYTTLGQKVMTVENTQSGIDVSGLANGMYIMQRGESITKFIKE
ncbi:T9SS type A sorting domain-containing protein [Flavobacterium hauense]